MFSGSLKYRRIVRFERESQRGVAYAELLLVLPLVFLILFGSLEVARYLRVSESVSELSRTIGEQVYRECLGLPDAGKVSDCIRKNVSPPVTSSDVPLLDNVQVVITVWRNRPAGGAPNIARVFYGGFAADASGAAIDLPASFPDNTRYDGSTPTAASDPLLYQSILANYKELTAAPANKFVGGVAIVEVTVPYQPISGRLLPFLNLSQVYEQTIY